MYNEVNKYIVMPGHILLVTFFMIVSIFVSIRYYDAMPIYLYMEWPGYLVSMTTFIIVFDTISALIYEQSVTWKQSMRKVSGNKLLKAKIASFRPIRCEVGDFFFYRMSTAFNFMSNMLNNAIALLIM